MGFLGETTRFALNPLSAANSERNGAVPSRADQDLQEYRTVRNTQWTFAILHFVFIRGWFVSVPLVLMFIHPAIGVVSFLFAAGLKFYLVSNREGRSQEQIKAVGGPENASLIEVVMAHWPEVMFRAGLTQGRAPTEGVGLREAYASEVYKRQRSLAANAFGSSDLTVPEVITWTPSPLGPRALVQMLRGQTVESFSKVAQMLADAWGVNAVRVDQDRPGVAALVLVIADPLSRSLEVDLSRPVDGSVDGVPIGVKEDGAELLFPLDQSNAVVGGIPGAGKSVSLNVLLAGISAVPEIQIVGIDCKGGIEFYDWQPRLSAFAQDQETALDVLQKVDEMGKRRLDALRGSGFKSQSRKGYSVEEPLIVVVIDECAELFTPEGSSKEQKSRANDLQSLVSRGVRLYRAAGICFVLATQKPTTDSIPSIIRDNCKFRLAFRCTTEEQAVAIMGAEIRSSDVSPVSIPDGNSFKGYCVLGDDAGSFARGRGAMIQESTCSALAESGSLYRRSLEEVVA